MEYVSFIFILAFIYVKYSMIRVDKVHNIRIFWIFTKDPRLTDYTIEDMLSLSWSNWFGFKYPNESHYKKKALDNTSRAFRAN